MLKLLASVLAAVAVAQSCQPTSSASFPNPATCRMIVTGQQVHALVSQNFDSSSASAIIMHFDVQDDPAENGTIFQWIGGLDPFGKDAFDYTRSAGPLGVNSPLGYAGPLGSLGNLPNRFHGHTGTSRKLTWQNNWCAVPITGNDTGCVYGSYGPLGESGPLNPYSYFYTMYHLGEGVNWSQNYNVNLDSSGVWGIQGPLGPTGALGVLGALGPLGISLQHGVTTKVNGEYSVDGVGVIRTTSPLKYAHDGSIFRQYDLVEFYTKKFAMNLPYSNDCSFAVDSYLSDPASGGDSYAFTSNYTHFVSINVVPINMLDQFGLDLYTSSGTLIASSHSKSLQNFIVFRANAGESFSVTVSMVTNGAPVVSGYYLYVTGSGFLEGPQGSLSPADDWGPRTPAAFENVQYNTFNINGAHQSWVPF